MNKVLNCIEGCNIPSDTNEIKIYVKRLIREFKEFYLDTTKTLLEHDSKMAELCNYLKDNLSDSLRCLLDTMIASGELEQLIKEMLCNHDPVSVKEYGAIGDGLTDDTVAFLTAIEDADKNGCVLLVPEGTYLIKRTLVFPKSSKCKNFVLKGINKRISTLKFDLTEGTAIDMQGEDSDRIYGTIEDIRIESANTNQVDGITLKNNQNTKILDNVHIQGFYNNIYINKNWTLRIQDVTSVNALNCNLNMSNDVVNSLIIDGGSYAGSKGINIYIHGHNHHISNCDISQGQEATGGVYANYCHGLNITGCYFESNSKCKEYGIRLTMCNGVVINGLDISANSQITNYKHIYIESSKGVVVNGLNIESGNTTNIADYGVYILDSNGVVLNSPKFETLNTAVYIKNSILTIHSPNMGNYVNKFIEQFGHIYARIDGNMTKEQYIKSNLPRKDVTKINILNILNVGNTTSRPEPLYPGQSYLDLSLGKMIYCKQANVYDTEGNLTDEGTWIDANGIFV